MLWTDVNEIAIELYEKHPDVNPRYILFTDLHNLVLSLEGFNDDPAKSNERILESIQMNWIEEID
ncbi:MAG: Fe-S assembly protein IscX [Gammaproteobacteria bacterium]|jgi:FeS assembly protein IscX|nr:MAG: Fe-S assembly protein IscX [Gammaproteobacteria bacterium]